jgi:hypothetical protein
MVLPFLYPSHRQWFKILLAKKGILPGLFFPIYDAWDAHPSENYLLFFLLTS